MLEIRAVTVEREVRIAARPETIYSFFIDPQKMLRWKGIEAALDPRPGGALRINVTGRDVVSGAYVELTPYSRVVFTWGWEAVESRIPPGSSTVEITLIPDGDETIVRLCHRDLPPEARESHGIGWDHYLSRLALVATGNDPGIDPWTLT